MLVEQIWTALCTHPFLNLFWATIVFTLFNGLLNKYGNGINSIPGPFLASFTNLWRLFVVLGRRAEREHIRLNEKYGPLVRIGPNNILVSDINAVRIIYGLNTGFVKSEFYPVQQTVAKGRRLLTLFTSTDEKFHAKLRRHVNNAYAMSTLVQFEPLVDSSIVEFLTQLRKRYADNKGPDGVCDFGAWLQYYAFDVIGELTYSKRLGFVERGVDVDDIIGNLQWLLNYAAVVGQLPFLDRIFLKNPVRLAASQYGLLNSNSPVVEFAKDRIASRPNVAAGVETMKQGPDGKPERRDFLSRFYEAHYKDPEFMSHERVLAVTVANMFAGSDTTAITLRAIFYFLLTHPKDMQALMKELWTQKEAGVFTSDVGLVSWNDVKDLPYLSAVIKETLRQHPAAGLPLERIVPPSGATICGKFIPGGTIVGCNAWTLHRDPVFGERTEEYRPRRWIEASPEKKRNMENSIFSFGAGARTCIGRNISYLEMYKLVPAILMNFDVCCIHPYSNLDDLESANLFLQIELADPSKTWRLHNAWFVKQDGLNVRLKSRKRNFIMEK